MLLFQIFLNTVMNYFSGFLVAIFMLVCALQRALIWRLFLTSAKESEFNESVNFIERMNLYKEFCVICAFSNISEYSYELFFWFSCSHIHVGLCFATGINLAPLSDICQRMLAMQFSAQNSVR